MSRSRNSSRNGGGLTRKASLKATQKIKDSLRDEYAKTRRDYEQERWLQKKEKKQAQKKEETQAQDINYTNPDQALDEYKKLAEKITRDYDDGDIIIEEINKWLYTNEFLYPKGAPEQRSRQEANNATARRTIARKLMRRKILEYVNEELEQQVKELNQERQKLSGRSELLARQKTRLERKLSRQQSQQQNQRHNHHINPYTSFPEVHPEVCEVHMSDDGQTVDAGTTMDAIEYYNREANSGVGGLPSFPEVDMFYYDQTAVATTTTTTTTMNAMGDVNDYINPYEGEEEDDDDIEIERLERGIRDFFEQFNDFEEMERIVNDTLAAVENILHPQTYSTESVSAETLGHSTDLSVVGTPLRSKRAYV